MDQKQIAKQWIEFNKTAFDNTFNAMTMLQDQTEGLVSHFSEKATYFPEEGKKALHDWINAYKKGREDFKTTADENYKKVTDYFADFQKEAVEKGGEKIIAASASHEVRNERLRTQNAYLRHAQGGLLGRTRSLSKMRHALGNENRSYV